MTTQRIPTASIKISQIQMPDRLRTRAADDQEYIRELVEAYNEGAKTPPIELVQDGDIYWCADGRHRVKASAEVGFLDINANVRPGKIIDAIEIAIGANTDHGLRRTNKDKRRAVEVALKEFPKTSDGWIADACHVDCSFVCKMRPTCDNHKSGEREGRDGRTTNTTNIGKKKSATTEPNVPITDGDEKESTTSKPSSGADEPKSQRRTKKEIKDEAEAEFNAAWDEFASVVEGAKKKNWRHIDQNTIKAKIEILNNLVNNPHYWRTV